LDYNNKLRVSLVAIVRGLDRKHTMLHVKHFPMTVPDVLPVLLQAIKTFYSLASYLNNSVESQ
jgi:hypothetical protein